MIQVREFKSAEEMRTFYRGLHARMRALGYARPQPGRVRMTPFRQIVDAVAKSFDLPPDALCVSPDACHLVGLLANELLGMLPDTVAGALRVTVTAQGIAALQRRTKKDQMLALQVHRLRKALLEEDVQ